MHTHHALCNECKAYRKYEGETLGDCLEQLASDGWVMDGSTKLMCPECVQGKSNHLQNV